MVLSNETIKEIVATIKDCMENEEFLESGWNGCEAEFTQGKYNIFVDYSVLAEVKEDYYEHDEVYGNSREYYTTSENVAANIDSIVVYDDETNEELVVENTKTVMLSL